MRKPDTKVLEVKEKLLAAGIDDSNLVYMPLVPETVTGLPREFIIEEEFGMKVARLVSAANN